MLTQNVCQFFNIAHSMFIGVSETFLRGKEWLKSLGNLARCCDHQITFMNEDLGLPYKGIQVVGYAHKSSPLCFK